MLFKIHKEGWGSYRDSAECSGQAHSVYFLGYTRQVGGMLIQCRVFRTSSECVCYLGYTMKVVGMQRVCRVFRTSQTDINI